MSTEEIQEATETTAPRSGNDNSSSSGSAGGGGVPGLPHGSRGKIIIPSELSVIPPSSSITGIPATHEDVDEGELDDKISELRDKNNGNKLLDVNVISSSSCNSSSSKGGNSYVDQLTKEQYDDMCYSFSLFDTDGDGKISKNDIHHASKMFGTQKDVTAMLGDHVEEGVTLEEFIEIMAPTFQSIREDPMEKVIREAFDIFDEDRNGFISAKEIHGLMLKLGEDLSPHEVDVMLHLVDVDGDGQISFEEFHRHIMKDPNGILLESGNNSPVSLR